MFNVPHIGRKVEKEKCDAHKAMSLFFHQQKFIVIIYFYLFFFFFWISSFEGTTARPKPFVQRSCGILASRSVVCNQCVRTHICSENPFVVHFQTKFDNPSAVEKALTAFANNP